MDDIIQISTLNDFIFCPKSLFYHSIYQKYDNQNYHQEPQINGTNAHKTIDEKTYSSLKKYIISKPIYSTKYNLTGKIDIYDSELKKLIERKYKINKIYKGHILQLHAQYYCMVEMGYEIEALEIRSLSDNINYAVDLPTDNDINEFAELINKIRNYNINTKINYNEYKCRSCIYNPICDTPYAIT